MENIKTFVKKYKFLILGVLVLVGLAAHIATEPQAVSQITGVAQTQDAYEAEVEAYLIEYGIPIEEEKAQSEWRLHRYEEQQKEEAAQNARMGIVPQTEETPLETPANPPIEAPSAPDAE